MRNKIQELKNRWKRAATALRVARGEQGFTLTEMLIVIAIIALIGTFVAGNVIEKFNRAKVSATETQIRNIGSVLDQFKLECGFYPLTDQGLEALIHKPAEGRECKNYDPNGYIKGGKIPKDGFGNEFIYTSDGNKYSIKSLGNDGKEGGEGLDKDISSEDM